MKTFCLAAQISTAYSSAHSRQEELSTAAIQRVLREVHAVMPLDKLIVGGPRRPDIFHTLTSPPVSPVNEVYLWYNLLSDYPGQTHEELVVNVYGESSAGWSGWQASGAEVDESFQFGCPNNPFVRRKTLAGLDELLRTYPFDGLFLDKFRFPSLANGLEMALSCFCPYCRQAARGQGLDLSRVRDLLLDWDRSKGSEEGERIPPGSVWLEELVESRPLLQRFIRFRAGSISALVEEVKGLVDSHGRKLALDLFTPAFAPLVGQDYPVLARLAEWVKPMTYRAAYGPAGFRLEAEALVSGLERIYRLSPSSILSWAERTCGYSAAGYRQMVAQYAPMEWMQREIQRAVELLAPKPVLMGLETVSFPGVIEVTPPMVKEMLTTGLENGVDGAVISWDLMHTPVENILAIRESI